ncbi:hypothetical protein [Lacihabitans lacunae]|uniref:DUF4868 domain-containing protein n=1 Tax=Lacihabitans lacunae TaxID=1028214 RepID=A0ABV7YVD6_9BACT
MSIFKNIFSSKTETGIKKQSDKIYFKILNFNLAEGKLDSARLESLQEYDGEYNYELSNEYFENALFFSESEIELIKFQIFFTKHAHFRYPEFYNDAQVIQDYYEKKYQTPFFFALSDDELKKKYHPTFQLGKHLNFEDYKSVIQPNLKLELIRVIEPEKIHSDNFSVFYNWDFFEETQISPFSNSFLRFIEAIPYDSRKTNYDSKEKAKIGAFNALLENASSTADTTLKGLSFHLRNSGLKTLSKDSSLNKPKVIPAIRSLNELESGVIMDEINASISEMEQQTMEPFEIIKNS